MSLGGARVRSKHGLRTPNETTAGRQGALLDHARLILCRSHDPAVIASLTIAAVRVTASCHTVIGAVTIDLLRTILLVDALCVHVCGTSKNGVRYGRKATHAANQPAMPCASTSRCHTCACARHCAPLTGAHISSAGSGVTHLAARIRVASELSVHIWHNLGMSPEATTVVRLDGLTTHPTAHVELAVIVRAPIRTPGVEALPVPGHQGVGDVYWGWGSGG